MDGESRKRKGVENGEERRSKRGEEEEEDEEEKMEKFFALIRSSREVRERMRRSLSYDQFKEKTTGVDHLQVWKPSFQPEDFLPDSGHGRDHDLQGGPSKKEDEKKKDEDGGGEGGSGLDLKLSL